MTFEVDHERAVILISAKGIVTLHDILTNLKEREEVGAACYSQLVDGRDVQLDLSIQDLPKIASATRKSTHGGKIPKIAIVTDSFYFRTIAMAYAGLTRADTPEFKIFASLAPARAWLMPDSE